MNRNQLNYIQKLKVRFPNLTPAQRGILSEALATLTRSHTIEEIKTMLDLYLDTESNQTVR